MPQHHLLITLSAGRITKYHTVRRRLMADIRAGHTGNGFGGEGSLRSLLDKIGKCRICGADPVPGARAVSGGSKWFYCMTCARSKGLV